MIDRAAISAGHSVLIEFGDITPEQRRAIDRHPHRCCEPVPRDHADRNVFSFSVDPGQTGDDVYDDVRGWAIGKAIPIIRHIDR